MGQVDIDIGGEKYRPLSLLGATQQLSSDVIVFRATVENSDCATDLVQSRLPCLQLRLVPLQKSFVFKRKAPE